MSKTLTTQSDWYLYKLSKNRVKPEPKVINVIFLRRKRVYLIISLEKSGIFLMCFRVRKSKIFVVTSQIQIVISSKLSGFEQIDLLFRPRYDNRQYAKMFIKIYGIIWEAIVELAWNDSNRNKCYFKEN